jgi:alpha-L-arabinofuranosidase
MAALAQLVNVIAPITTERGGRAWRQTTFFPFADVAATARGQALRVELKSPKHATVKYGEVDSVVAAATHDSDNGDLMLYVVNRSPDVSTTLELELAGSFLGYRPIEHRLLQTDDPTAKNTADKPHAVVPRIVATHDDNLVLAPISWNVIRLRRHLESSDRTGSGGR